MSFPLLRLCVQIETAYNPLDGHYYSVTFLNHYDDQEIGGLWGHGKTIEEAMRSFGIQLDEAQKSMNKRLI